MSTTGENIFKHAKRQLDAIFIRDKHAIESAGIALIDTSARQARTSHPLFLRYTFEISKIRGENIGSAGVTLWLSESDPSTLFITEHASLRQEKQVEWWVKSHTTTMLITNFLTLELATFILPAIERGFAASTDAVRTSSRQIAALLYELCVDSGFCLPREDTESLLNNPPADIDVFTDAVFRAEKMNPYANPTLRNAMRQKISDCFESIEIRHLPEPDAPLAPPPT